DDESIIAGQGTVGLEVAEDLMALRDRVDAVLICCGGGGLTAGCAIAIKATSPATAIYAVEPDGYDDHARSLKTGNIETVRTLSPSICDALLAPQPGALTFSINSNLLAGGLAVSDEEVRGAVRYAFNKLKLVLEPSGAVALAALLSGKLASRYKSVAIILSGGNVDPSVFADCIAVS
ncbi:MAG: pyridoxal-phosphate dependent enzyme, partial [Pseudomonadota bacterium]